MSEVKREKKSIAVMIDAQVRNDFYKRIIDLYDGTKGHIGNSLEEAIKLWLKHKKVGEFKPLTEFNNIK